MLDYDVERPRYSVWSQLAILLFLTGIGLLIGGIVSIPIATAYLNVPLQQLQQALLKSENANLSRVLQFVTTLFFMGLPSLIFARIINRKPFTYIGFNSAISGKQVFIIIGILLFGLAISGTLSSVNEMIPISKPAEHYFKELENEYNKEMLAIANMKTMQDYIISLIMIALLPAIFEEMLFRGALQPIMINLTKNAFVGIFITSILFSAIHMSYYGFLPRLALGLIIGYVFYFSKNLWLSSITHFLYNAFGVTQLYALSKQGLLNQDALNDDSFPLYYGIIAAVALYVLFIFFKRESQVEISMHNIKKM
ncbi:MAG: CPBP family intramembrane glutamic endopeptidase [Parafilimonas sp.]